MVLVSAHSNLLFQIFQCGLGGFFDWVGCIFGGIFKLWVFFGGYILFARDWNLHIIDSLVVGALDWSFIKLDAAWHEWISIALTVMIDGVLAVCAQCGCCHQFLQYLNDLPFHVYFALVTFFFHLLVCIHFCHMSSGFVQAILHIILHGLLFVFFYTCSFWSYMVYILWGLWVLFWWGVLFCCLCTTTSLCLPCSPSNVYSFIFLLLCFVYLFLNCHIPLVFLLPICVSFIHAWMKTFGGCMHMHHMQLYVCSEICLLNVLYYIWYHYPG